MSAPFVITAYLTYQIVTFFDGLAKQIIPGDLGFAIPGLGLLFTMGLLILIGMFTAGFFGRSLVKTGELVLDRLPVVRSIYATLKQIFETVLASSSRSFREVVLVEYPRRGIWAIAFVTADAPNHINDVIKTDDHPDHVTVFLPTTPNPTSGFLLLVSRNDMKKLDMAVEDAVKLVISGGIVAPPKGQNDEPYFMTSLPQAQEPDADSQRGS